MTYVIVQDGAKFKIKELNETGGTKQLLPEEFDSHNEASKAVQVLEAGDDDSSDSDEKTFKVVSEEGFTFGEEVCALGDQFTSEVTEEIEEAIQNGVLEEVVVEKAKPKATPKPKAAAKTAKPKPKAK